MESRDFAASVKLTREIGGYNLALPSGGMVHIERVSIAGQARWDISIADVTVEALTLGDARRFLSHIIGALVTGSAYEEDFDDNPDAP